MHCVCMYMCTYICVSLWCILLVSSALFLSELCLLPFFSYGRPAVGMAEEWRGIWIGKFVSIVDKFTSFSSSHPLGSLHVPLHILAYLEVSLRLRPRANSLFLIKVWCCWLRQKFVSAVSEVSGAGIADMLSLGIAHLCMAIGQKKVSSCFLC